MADRYKLVIEIDGLETYTLEKVADFISATRKANMTNDLTNDKIASMLASIGYEVEVEQGDKS